LTPVAKLIKIRLGFVFGIFLAGGDKRIKVMDYSTIIFTLKDHVARITLNRPEADNTLNQQLIQELEDICSSINQADNIHVVILSGAGDRAFCVGSEDDAKSFLPLSALPGMNAAAAIASINQPVIAAINGDALGPGLELTLSCDIRLAAPGARFGLPEVAAGLIPMCGGTQRLPRLIGRGKALELILTAETINAEEALKIGLVSRIVPQPELMAEAEALARNIAGKAPIALRYIKEAVNQGMDLTLEQGLHLEADLYFLLHTTSDRTEGVKAFLEKRVARFQGK